ncbi:MAG: hypothetical protein JXA21_06270 [Anaerolineae bacterium]|nr:hypothetical protein [Anaerolineae bacterium]
MAIVNMILATLICAGLILLQVIFMGIARFFERTSGQVARYRLYWIPIALTVFSAIRYLPRVLDATDPWPDFVGDPWANSAMFIAGIMLIVLSNALYEKMMGGEKYSEPR